jgi:hypothetical protein
MCIRPRLLRDPIVVEVVEAAERQRGRDSEGKIKEAAHLCAKPLARLAFRCAVEEGGELL